MCYTAGQKVNVIGGNYRNYLCNLGTSASSTLGSPLITASEILDNRAGRLPFLLQIESISISGTAVELGGIPSLFSLAFDK